MSYRPQIKKSDGTMQDLPLDAETVKGMTIGQIATKDTITDAEVATNANIAQSKVSGLMTDYVASISVSGRTVTYKNKNGVNMGSITTQDTTYGLASQSSNGLMSSTDKTKLDGIESGAQKNTVLGVKGGSESAYRTGNVNITKANIGLGNVDNTSDEDKPVSTATQTALNGKANTSGTYPNLTVGKATNADNATNATNATNASNATKATQDASGNVITSTYATKTLLNQIINNEINISTEGTLRGGFQAGRGATAALSGVAIGLSATSNGGAIALGTGASATGLNAVQLGGGSNTEANTLKYGSYKVMDGTGTLFHKGKDIETLFGTDLLWSGSLYGGGSSANISNCDDYKFLIFIVQQATMSPYNTSSVIMRKEDTAASITFLTNDKVGYVSFVIQRSGTKFLVKESGYSLFNGSTGWQERKNNQYKVIAIYGVR